MKTLIELFDECQIENAIAGLRFKPEKIVFIGHKQVMNEGKSDALKEFFDKKAPDTLIEFVTVDTNDYADVTDVLNVILDKNEDCCFDVTGGAELVLVAMGAVSARRDVPMVKFNVRNGNITRINCDESFAGYEKSYLTIKEIVELNGSEVIDTPDSEDFDFTPEFKRDLDSIWRAAVTHPGAWNKQISALKSFEKRGGMDDSLRVRCSFDRFSHRGKSELVFSEVIKLLSESRILRDVEISDSHISFRYKDMQVYKCLTKAGNILEIYAYMLLSEITEENPGYYDDVSRSVSIDWDGIIYDRSKGVSDTKNEIDVMAMRDLVPVFISCKNGDVDKSALYELDTVSRRIGGKYAKRVLIATYISDDINTYNHIRQRAKDMQIGVICDVDRMTRDEFKKELKSKIT